MSCKTCANRSVYCGEEDCPYADIDYNKPPCDHYRPTVAEIRRQYINRLEAERDIKAGMRSV